MEDITYETCCKMALFGMGNGSTASAALCFFGGLERVICGDMRVPAGQFHAIANITPATLDSDPDAVSIRWVIDDEADWCEVPKMMQELVILRLEAMWLKFRLELEEAAEEAYPDDWAIRINRFKMTLSAATFIRHWGRHFGEDRRGPRIGGPDLDCLSMMSSEKALVDVFRKCSTLNDFLELNMTDEWPEAED